MAYSIIEIVQQKHESQHEPNWKARGYCVINRSQEGDWGITFSIIPIQSRKLSLSLFSPCMFSLSVSQKGTLYVQIQIHFSFLVQILTG